MPGGAGVVQALKSQPADELEVAQRRVKLRTLGNIRLIAQLFNEGVVAEKIVHACIGDLLGNPKAPPVEDNAEVGSLLALLPDAVLPGQQPASVPGWRLPLADGLLA